MVEAIAMLGLISLVTPVVYKKSAERMTELQDINAATQIRTLSRALDTYLQDQYDDYVKTHKKADGTWDVGAASEEKIEVSPAALAPYLPSGMIEGGNITGAFDDYKLSFTGRNISSDSKKPHFILTGYVGAKGDEAITPQRASRIATMVGSNGGYVEGNVAHGVNGIWESQLDPIGMGDMAVSDEEDGSINPIVATSESAVSSAGAYVDTRKFLHRTEEDDLQLNTMESDIYMYDTEETDPSKASHSIQGINRLLVGYQKDRNNNEKGSKDAAAKPDDYSLYLSGARNTWLGGTLQAAQGRFSVNENDMIFMPNVGDTKSLFEIRKDIGMDYMTPDGEKFVVHKGVMEFGNGSSQLINTAYKEGKMEVALVKKDSEDSAKFTVTEEQTTANNQFVANAKGEYDAGSKRINGNYTKVGGTGNFNAAVGDQDNVLTGKTYATQIETGYLQTHDFDTLNLRAGRSDFNDGDERWNLEVDDTRVDIGYGGDAHISVSPLNNGSTGHISMDTQAGDISMSTQSGKISMITNGENADIEINAKSGADVDIASAGAGDITVGQFGDLDLRKGILMESAGNSRVELESNMYGISSGNIAIARSGSSNGLIENDDLKRGYQGLAITDSNTTMQGKDVNIRTNATTTGEGEGATTSYGKVTVESKNLWVDDKTAAIGESNVPGKDASVYIRHGAIEVKTEDGDGLSADTGTGYVKADRFVVENTASSGTSRDPREVYRYYNEDGSVSAMNLGQDSGIFSDDGGTKGYDHYMIDPAYTSVMHDIKLTSRGGARLSDILPDFINKGIYVVDNSYGEDMTKEQIIDLEEGKAGATDGKSPFASAWLGRVPAPQCPPGYAKVITVTPAGWRMSQTGELVAYSDDDVTNRMYLNEVIPTINKEDGTFEAYEDVECSVTADIEAGIGSVSVKCPQKKVFQGSTWMKSAILPSYGEVEEVVPTTYAQGGGQYTEKYTGFKGWLVRMGYIYPHNLWNHLLTDSGVNAELAVDNEGLSMSGEGDDTKIYWNLFPVDKYSIEGYATVYCYFDREGLTNADDTGMPRPYFNPSFVDTTSRVTTTRSVEQGASKYAKDKDTGATTPESEAYMHRLFNPNLKYDQQW